PFYRPAQDRTERVTPASRIFGKISRGGQPQRAAAISSGGYMAVRLIPFVGFILGLVTVAGGALAQQVQPAPKPKPLDEIEAAQQTAKTAAEFEFLGALARTCF